MRNIMNDIRLKQKIGENVWIILEYNNIKER